MAAIKHYKIYCETDAKWEYWYLPEGDAPPTTCPTNTAHAVTAGSVSSLGVIGTAQLLREDGSSYTVPKPSSYGQEMNDRDFRVSTCVLSDACEDLKFNPSLRLEEQWNELTLNGVYKNDAGSMVAVTDQADADANGILTVFDYCAKFGGSAIRYEMRDGILYVDPAIFVDPANPTYTERFGYRAYAVIAPGIPASQGGSIAVFDGYLGGAPDLKVAALSPQATVLDPDGPAGAAGVVLRLALFHPAGSKLHHVLRVVMYRSPGTF